MSNSSDNYDIHPKPRMIDTNKTETKTDDLQTDNNTDLMFDRFADKTKLKSETVNPVDRENTPEQKRHVSSSSSSYSETD